MEIPGQSLAETDTGMVSALARLHPDRMDCDQRFARLDPLRPLRKQVDLGRLRRLMAGTEHIPVSFVQEYRENDRVALVLDAEMNKLSFASEVNRRSLPNMGCLELPKDIAELNRMLRVLGITCLVCDNERVLGKLRSLAAGQPYEMGIATQILVAEKRADATFTAK